MTLSVRKAEAPDARPLACALGRAFDADPVMNWLRTPAYLESSQEANLAFYHRHGFEVTGAVDLPGGGPGCGPCGAIPVGRLRGRPARGPRDQHPG